MTAPLSPLRAAALAILDGEPVPAEARRRQANACFRMLVHARTRDGWRHLFLVDRNGEAHWVCTVPPPLLFATARGNA